MTTPSARLPRWLHLTLLGAASLGALGAGCSESGGDARGDAVTGGRGGASPSETGGVDGSTGGGASTGGAGSGGASTGGASTGGADGGSQPGGGGAGTGGEVEPPACEGVVVDSGSALSLDGDDDHVTMGAAPALGLATFTLEAWVRRTGTGETAGSGAGGLQIVPVIAKGRGENDGSNVDCNYLFGFVGDTLAIDFEDLATGANHPFQGSVAVPADEWHHVAATFDGAGFALYVDGVLDGTQAVSATPRSDSIQHFAIGAALDSSGTPEGAFAGLIDEVRIWSVARTGAEIAAARFDELESASGLVARYAFDAGAPTGDSVGTTNGVAAGGAATVASGAPVGRGLPPTVSGASPTDGATVPPGSVTLRATVSDPEALPLAVTFEARRVPPPEEDFTIAVLPDTQYYSEDYPATFAAQTQWIMDQKDARRIVAVIHNGDIVDDGGDTDQWDNADAAMDLLEVTTAPWPEGMPYGVAVGNHDQSPIGTTGSTTLFNSYFGPSRFEGRSYYGGHLGSGNENSYFTFSVGELRFIVVSIEYDTSQDQSVLDWAAGVLEAHPDHIGVVNSHYIVGTGNPASFGAQGQAIYDGLSDVPNLYYMTCGHIAGEGRRVDPGAGHDIHTMLADYQGRQLGGDGWLRLWEVSPSTQQIAVRTYSPTRAEWETDDSSEFTIPLPAPLTDPEFELLATIDPTSDGEVSTTMTGLVAGEVIEWRVVTSDCQHEVVAGGSFTVE